MGNTSSIPAFSIPSLGSKSPAESPCPIMRCCLKKHGAFLVNFVIDFANGDMSREEFDMDYSGYVIEHFPEFEREHPRLSRRFADTIDRTYSTCSWMTDDAFQYAIGDAVDTFLGEAPEADIY